MLERPSIFIGKSPGVSVVKNKPANEGDVGLISELRRFPAGAMATYFRFPTWEIPWRQESGRYSPWVVKLIQNLEIKMESQINSLETSIEKMQERFNKDLEEIKKESIYNE